MEIAIAVLAVCVTIVIAAWAGTASVTRSLGSIDTKLASHDVMFGELKTEIKEGRKEVREHADACNPDRAVHDEKFGVVDARLRNHDLAFERLSRE